MNARTPVPRRPIDGGPATAQAAEAEPPPVPGRRERKRQALADHLADIAWDMFQAFGFDAVSMEAIAEAADVAKATLYKHFPVKGALIAHRLHRELAEGMPAYRAELARLPDTESRLRAFLAAAAEWIGRHPGLFAPYVRYRLSTLGEVLGPNGDVGQRSGTAGAYLALLQAGQAQGDVRRDLDASLMADHFHALYLAALTRWLASPELDLRTEFDRMVDLFVHGVGSPR